MFYGRNKYHNTKTEYDGIKFDSKKECARYIVLKEMEQAGKIRGLELQKRFLICPKSGNNRRARYYVADFVYWEGDDHIIEDVKSDITRKNPVYTLKKALMLWLYSEYVFREVN